MPVSLAGIDLTPPEDSQRLTDEWYHAHRIEDFEHPGYFAPNVSGSFGISLPQPYPPRREPPRIGVWHKPTSASRWGVCYLLANSVQIAQIRALGPGAFPLVMTDGTNTVTDQMIVLPPRPIAQRGQGNDLYLLTLVDSRWAWWLPQLDTQPDPSTWTNLISTYFQYIANTIPSTIDPPPAAYGLPNIQRWIPNWNGMAGNPFTTPPILDALCRTVGLWTVYDSSTSVRVVNYATAAAEDAARWQAWQGQYMAGGILTNADVSFMIPSVVGVQFAGLATPFMEQPMERYRRRTLGIRPWINSPIRLG